MPYVITLLAALVAFVWFTPARTSVGEAIVHGGRAAISAAVDHSGPLKDKALELGASLRTKSMDILRGQIHEAVDDLVQ